MDKKDILILCDFDGTTCSNDMGYQILNRFAKGWQEIDRAYISNKIGSRLAYLRIQPLFRGTETEMVEYALHHEKIDPHFHSFYRFCKDQGMDLKIVSDGLDFYISSVLRKHELHEIEFYANKVVFRDDSTLSIEFPSIRNGCDRCGTCKSTILNFHRKNYRKIIYIGDSYSDVCPSKIADLVFAKQILSEKCRKNGKACIDYENFFDVRKYLSKILRLDSEGKNAEFDE
ncbi:MAG: 2-hydroxy-3-keto-5-methylthiopentenyl-1-phosphate phosphatase [Syntrophus sp. PtaB.Bin001]|nr:MAG: 2-hydroxy-3-keto-5-methylthiopentenyl-1-phosphate phosphatase [Syntrophus sp. PtaB.Bin001]